MGFYSIVSHIKYTLNYKFIKQLYLMCYKKKYEKKTAPKQKCRNLTLEVSYMGPEEPKNEF